MNHAPIEIHQHMQHHSSALDLKVPRDDRNKKGEEKAVKIATQQFKKNKVPQYVTKQKEESSGTENSSNPGESESEDEYSSCVESEGSSSSDSEEDKKVVV